MTAQRPVVQRIMRAHRGALRSQRVTLILGAVMMAVLSIEIAALIAWLRA